MVYSSLLRPLRHSCYECQFIEDQLDDCLEQNTLKYVKAWLYTWEIHLEFSHAAG